MNWLGELRGCCFVHSGVYLEAKVVFHGVGDKLYLTVTLRNHQIGQESSTMICLGEQERAALPIPGKHYPTKPEFDPHQLTESLRRGMSEAVADLLSKAVDWQKSGDGLYVPKVHPGDTIIVDKPGAEEIKVLDVSEQAYEKIPKKKMSVEDKKCVCSIRDLCMRGCACGGK